MQPDLLRAFGIGMQCLIQRCCVGGSIEVQTSMLKVTPEPEKNMLFVCIYCISLFLSASWLVEHLSLTPWGAQLVQLPSSPR